jgi:hypothetical protein
VSPPPFPGPLPCPPRGERAVPPWSMSGRAVRRSAPRHCTPGPLPCQAAGSPIRPSGPQAVAGWGCCVLPPPCGGRAGVGVTILHRLTPTPNLPPALPKKGREVQAGQGRWLAGATERPLPYPVARWHAASCRRHKPLSSGRLRRQECVPRGGCAVARWHAPWHTPRPSLPPPPGGVTESGPAKATGARSRDRQGAAAGPLPDGRGSDGSALTGRHSVTPPPPDRADNRTALVLTLTCAAALCDPLRG